MLLEDLTFTASGTVAYGVHTGVRPQGVVSVSSLSGLSLAISDSFILHADSTGAAAIDVLTGSSITGAVTVHTYMGADPDWRFLGANAQGATLNSISDDIVLYGFPGAPFTGSGSSNTWSYTAGSGYTMPGSGLATTMSAGQGWQVYTFYSEDDFDMTGTPVQGIVNYSVGGSSGSFNLLANSYPAPIDWDAATGWTKTNMGSTIYIWDADNDVYATYNAGTGVATGSGSQYIASGQSFFVASSGSSPALSSTEEVKAAHQNPDFLQATGVNTLRPDLR